jgi:hypothetical protein
MQYIREERPVHAPVPQNAKKALPCLHGDTTLFADIEANPAALIHETAIFAKDRFSRVATHVHEAVSATDQWTILFVKLRKGDADLPPPKRS